MIICLVILQNVWEALRNYPSSLKNSTSDHVVAKLQGRKLQAEKSLVSRNFGFENFGFESKINV